MAELTLNTLDQAIDRRYQETNENLKAGKNSSLKVRADSTFHGSTPKVEDAESLPLGVFFPERKYIPMQEVLATVDQATNFLEELEHWQVNHWLRLRYRPLVFLAAERAGC